MLSIYNCNCWIKCIGLVNGNVELWFSNFVISILCHRNLHTTNTSQPAKLSIVYFISSHQLSAWLRSFQFSSQFFSNSKIPHNWFWPTSEGFTWNRHCQANMTIHLFTLWSLEGQSVDRYNIVQWTRQKGKGWETALYFLCFELREKDVSLWYWVGLQKSGYYCSCS